MLVEAKKPQDYRVGKVIRKNVMFKLDFNVSDDPIVKVQQQIIEVLAPMKLQNSALRS